MKKANVFKRILIALLSTVFVLQTFTACGTETETSQTDTQQSAQTETAVETEEETKKLWIDNLSNDLTYGGMDIVINARYDDSDEAGAYLEIDAEEEIGEILHDAIYNRNCAIEERLDVKITGFKGHNWQTYNEEIQRIRTSVAAGDNAWQIISGWNAYITQLALENCFYNLVGMENLETSQPWWNQSVVNGTKINDKMYFLTGDINILTMLGGSFVLFQNDNLATQYGVEDIPQLVLDGKWTLDKMAEIVAGVANDSNGDGIMDENDEWGFVTPTGNPADMFYTGADIHQIVLENGLPVFAPAEEKVSALYEKIYPFFYGGETSGSLSLSDESVTLKSFTDGNALMTCITLDTIRSNMREMEDDYTVIPTPKFDEAQESYRTSSFNGVCVLGIPSDNPAPAPAAAVMEAMAAYSYNFITDVYFEACLQEKYARNSNSVQMLNIIKENIYLDCEYLYRNILGETAYTMRNLLASSNVGVASWYAKNTKTIETKIEKAIEDFNK